MPAVERSMPACMTTSICPSAAIARIVPYGRMYDHDVFSSVLGAKSAATTRSAAIASQMGRKRAATSPLATTCAERPIVAPSATRSLSPGELMDRSIQSGGTVKSQPRPGVHSAHLEREVSTVTERTRACRPSRLERA